MIRPVRRVALYGYLGSGNIGNDATFETVLVWLQSRYPDLELRCMTNAPQAIADRFGVLATDLAWRPRSSDGSSRTLWLQKGVSRVLDIPRTWALAGAVDAIVVPGMGVLEDSLGVRPWGLPYWLFLTAAACRIRKRRFVLLGVGANYAANWLTRRLQVATVRLATYVSYRDRQSAEDMARAGAQDPDAITPDLVFAHPAHALAEPEPGLLVVGVMAYYGRDDDAVRGAAIRQRYVAAMAAALAELVTSNHRIVLVGGDQVDHDVARELKAAIDAADPGRPDDAIVVRTSTTFTELTTEMARAQVVVASRFHNLICALRAGRPAISIGYAPKSRHLMSALGIGDYCQDIRSLDAEDLVAQVRAAQSNATEIAARIQSGTRVYEANVRELLERVAASELGLAPPRVQACGRDDEVATCCRP